MEYDKYLELLTRRFGAYFNIKQNVDLLEHHWELSMEYLNRENHTFISKTNVMDYADTKEMNLVASLDHNGSDSVSELVKKLPEMALEYTGKLSRYHKSSKLNLILVKNAVATKDEIKAVKHFHFSKLHRMGFFGMTYADVVLMDLSCDAVYLSPGIKSEKKAFDPKDKKPKA